MVNRKRIALGMSGGVDSATSAALLMRAGYEVMGVTCLFLDSSEARTAAQDAAAVCEYLGIQHYIRDCVDDFEREVVHPFVDDYARGLTPSPCVHCNARCKIPSLIAAADERGCEKIATGHYARVAQLTTNGRFVIKAALDADKDQSYMLSQLSQEQLSRLVFPLGGSTKTEIRLIAEDIGLPVAHKPESQDICFIKNDYRGFLKARGVNDEPGDILDLSGRILGCHEGLSAYTLGQRKGIGVAASEPYYVVEKKESEHQLIVGFREQTKISSLRVAALNWQAFERLDSSLECMIKLRYRSHPVACVVEPDEDYTNAALASVDANDTTTNSVVAIRLLSPQTTTAPGQFAVFYQGETVLGGGVIISTQ